MKASILSFTRKGARLSLQIKDTLKQHGYETDCYTLKEFLTENHEWSCYEPDLKTVAGKLFSYCSLIVFVGACGIAVRTIAPWIKEKGTDPAVICLDEEGKHVISLLSGHIGGANRMTKAIAAGIGADPVITTATDINGLFAVDEWAKKNNLCIRDKNAVKKISSTLVDGHTVGFQSDFEIIGKIPEHLTLDGTCETGVCISLDESKKPYGMTLNLIPKVVYLGLGCRRDTSAEAIEELVLEILQKNNMTIQAIAGVGTIDLKENERGVLEFARKYSLPITFFSVNELDGVQGDFSGSGFVKQITGIDNVCERAAVLLSNQGKLICRKSVKNRVTAALALKRWWVSFED